MKKVVMATLGLVLGLTMISQESFANRRLRRKVRISDTINTQLDTVADVALAQEIVEPVEQMDVQDVDAFADQLPSTDIRNLMPRAAKTMDAAAHVPHENGMSIEKKREECVALVERGMAYLMKNPTDQVLSALSHDANFVHGELYLFVFNKKGVCLAHGKENHLIWENLYDFVDEYGAPVVQQIISEANSQKHGGWLTYRWRGATKVTYVREVVKGGESYIVGTGYYPHSKVDAVVSLVKGAVALFNQSKSEGRPTSDVFSTFSYPLGRFVSGDLYLYALDFKGNTMAHGFLPGIIGTSGWDYQDENGVYVNREIVKRLQETSEGVWIEYRSKRADKRAYAEKVVGPDGQHYFIACGYYPDADRDQAQELVRRGYTYIKQQGKTVAARAFSDKQSDEFRYGDIYLVVYDMKGVCVAHGANPALIGSDMFNVQGQDGNFYVKETIQKAKSGGGWINYKVNNLFKTSYVERVELGVGEFAISAGLYPISKHETAVLMAKSAASYLASNNEEAAFREFVKKDGRFTRGDLDVFAFDNSGICFAYGDDHDLIWRNLFKLKDEKKRPFVKIIINSAKGGEGVVSYHLNNAEKKAYVVPVEKNGKRYVIGSAYYL